MESYLPISYLNDFIFCPRSIYFHQLYGSMERGLYEQAPQLQGKAAHATIDAGTYTTSARVLVGVEVYSHTYRLAGKIDQFFLDTGELRERKRRIKHIYDGYIFQLYAQYAALTDMGHAVRSLSLYDLEQNKKHPVALPADDAAMWQRFENLVAAIQAYNPATTVIAVSEQKCRNCIYHNLCDITPC